jgi:hypothetical protein
MKCSALSAVMRGLDPRIHPFRMMDCRVKPGNDEYGWLLPGGRGEEVSRCAAMTREEETT